MVRGLSSRRVAFHCLLACIVAVCLAIVAPLSGGEISLKSALQATPWQAQYESTDALIFWGTRVPRVLTALLTGGALALAGLAFQAVLRNPLAEPYILGISAGAGMGKAASVLLWSSMPAVIATLSAVAFCFLGAVVPMLLLLAIAARQQRFSSVTLLLAGVMINVIVSAAMMLLHTFAPPDMARQVQLWWIGNLDVVGYRNLVIAIPLGLIIAAFLVLRGRNMNLISVEPITASNLGLNVERETAILLWSATLLTSIVVSIAGPIGFVGLLVPHVLRLVFGSDNRLLAPLSFIYGAAFLLLCDLLGWRGASLWNRLGGSLASTVEIPVGVITALVGGPLFLILLIRSQQESKSGAMISV